MSIIAPQASAARSLLLLLLCCAPFSGWGLTVQELRENPHLTPERFAEYFANFKFELREELQPRDQFLKSEAGDCDDFATLAADVLREKGYTTRLVVVFMKNDTHVVCYVKETGAFLDYNLRRNPTGRTVPANGQLSDIASKVARLFHSSWNCVSEFTYAGGERKFILTDFPQVAGK